MESRLKIARVLVTIPAIFLAVAPPLVDLNPSHVLNPLWIGHARMHTVWLIATNSLVSLVALGIMWRERSLASRGSVLLGACLVGCILLGFFAAAATLNAYDGSLTDPNGVGVTFGPFDANLVTFSGLFLVLAVGTSLARKPAA